MPRDGLQKGAPVQKTHVSLDNLPGGMTRERIADQTPAQAAALAAGRPIPDSPPDFSKVRFDPDATEQVWGLTASSGSDQIDGTNVRRFGPDGQIPFNRLADFAVAAELSPQTIAERTGLPLGDVLDYLDDVGDPPSERERRRLAEAVKESPAVVFPMTLNPAQQTERVADPARAPSRAPSQSNAASDIRERGQQRRRERAEDEVMAVAAEVKQLQADNTLSEVREGVLGVGRRFDRLRGRKPDDGTYRPGPPLRAGR
jgi:hypothetical protein